MPNARQSTVPQDVGSTCSALASTIAALAASGLLAMGTAQAQLAQVQEAIGAAEHGHPNHPHVQIVDVDPGVADALVRHARVPEGGLDVVVDVLASAQIGALFLSAGSMQLNLPGPGYSMDLWIEGTIGVRALSFASGTTLTNVAAAVNSYSEITGVQAVVSGTGLRLESSATGANQFISVVALAPSGLQGIETGLYRMEPTNTHHADPDTRVPILGWSALGDQGQDVQATVNGAPVATAGPTLRVRRPWLNADISLNDEEWSGPPAAQTLGSFLAFRVVEQ